MYLFIYLAVPNNNCSMWDLVPWPGIEPGPPALGAQVLTTGPPGSPQAAIFIQNYSVVKIWKKFHT